MYLQDTMDASVFLIGEGNPERPSLVFAHKTHDPEELLAYVKRQLRIRAPLVAPIQSWAQALEREGRPMQCEELGRVPSYHLNEGQEFYVRVLSLNGWRLVNATGNAYYMPERSSDAPELGKDSPYAYICAAWDRESMRCRKVGYTQDSPRGWLRSAIRYASRDRYMRRPMTDTTRWLASFDGKKSDDVGYPLVSLLEKTPLQPIREIRHLSRTWAGRLDAPIGADEEKT